MLSQVNHPKIPPHVAFAPLHTPVCNPQSAAVKLSSTLLSQSLSKPSQTSVLGVISPVQLPQTPFEQACIPA